MVSLARNGKTSTASTVPIALIYTRVSSDEQAKEGLSLESQLADVRRYIAGQGWIIGTEYQDILSGKRDDRPSYQAMLTEARRLRAEGKPVVIVVKWLHRLGRRVLERVRSREEMKSIGVPLYSIAEGGEVSDLVANILASVAEEEVRQLGERVSAVNAHLAQTGWARPGRVAWGYRWRPPTDEERANGAPRAVLDVDPDTAPFVRELYRRIADGATVRAMLKWVALLPSSARGARSLSLHAIQEAISRPLYIGCSEVDGELLPGRWPALVDRTTWDRVQAIVAEHKRIPRQASKRYLSTGLLRCPVCGARMQGTALRGRAHYYRCHGKDSGERTAVERNCTFSARQSVVDAAVLDQVSAVVDALARQDATFQAALKRAWRQLQRPAVGGDLATRAAQLERERTRAQDRLRRAALLFVDDKLDRAGYDLARDAAQADLDKATAELERMQTEAPIANLPPLETVLADLGDWATILTSGEIPARRDVLALLIGRVTPVRMSYGKYDVQVTWTALGESLRQLASQVSAR